ncbi:hypothetical protein [Aurantivibrio plasticivorans]
MSIYIIEPDYNYKELDLQVADFEDKFPSDFDMTETLSFSLHNLSLASFWPEMSTGFTETVDERLLPDIIMWLDYGLLLSPAAKIYLGEVLKPYGEFLPIHIDGEQWHIFNCLTVVDLDKEHSSERSIAFDKNLVGNKLIFKCLNPDNFGFYCQDKFKALVESYNLNGLAILPKRGDLLPEMEKEIVIVDD